MFPFNALASAGLGVMNLAGSLWAGDQNRDLSYKTNDFNAWQSQMNRDYQERMSSTAWQRGVADMRAAGINPMLAVSQGGATAPSGSSASGVTSSYENPMKGISSAIQLLELSNLQKQGKLLDSQIRKTTIEGSSSGIEATIRALQIPGYETENEIDKSEYGRKLRYVNRVLPTVGSASDVAGLLFKGLKKPSNIVPGGSVNTKTGEIYGYSKAR